MRNLTRRWQLKYVDVGENAKKVRFHGTVPRRTVRSITNSKSIAHEIRSTETDGATFGDVGQVEKSKSIVMDSASSGNIGDVGTGDSIVGSFFREKVLGKLKQLEYSCIVTV